VLYTYIILWYLTLIMDPKKFDVQNKNITINQNIYQCLKGDYICPVYDSIVYNYKKDVELGNIDNICKVIVSYKHSLDILEQVTEKNNKGFDNIKGSDKIPAVICHFGKTFTGLNFNLDSQSKSCIYDENIILRTNYTHIIKKEYDTLMYNKKEDTVIYSNPVTIIRDTSYTFLEKKDVFKTGVITLCYDKNKDLVNKLLSVSDLMTFKTLVEASFQVAICGDHHILIIPYFTNIPLEDQTLIFNLCIMKYGHKFKAIMICIPSYEDKHIFQHFDKNIVKPHILTKEIDNKYKSNDFSKKISKN